MQYILKMLVQGIAQGHSYAPKQKKRRNKEQDHHVSPLRKIWLGRCIHVIFQFKLVCKLIENFLHFNCPIIYSFGKLLSEFSANPKIYHYTAVLLVGDIYRVVIRPYQKF